MASRAEAVESARAYVRQQLEAGYRLQEIVERLIAAGYEAGLAKQLATEVAMSYGAPAPVPPFPTPEHPIDSAQARPTARPERRWRRTLVGVALALIGAGAGAFSLQFARGHWTRAPVSRGPFVELLHPASDDSGHYDPPPERRRVRVYGVVASAEKVARVSVNGQSAWLAPAKHAPFGASPEAPALEFRAYVAIAPGADLEVIIESETGEVSRVCLAPDSEAVEARIKALAAEPSASAVPHLRLANLLHSQAKFEQAIPEYQRAIELNPQSAEAHCQLAHLLLRMGAGQEALAEAQRATEIDPQYADAHHALWAIYASAGLKREALAELRQAAALAPQDVSTQEELRDAQKAWGNAPG